MSGWVFKTGCKGLGYYRDGASDEQVMAMHGLKESLRSLEAVVLKLEGLIPFKERMPIVERVGNPLEATVQDEEARDRKRKMRKVKASKARAKQVKDSDDTCLSSTFKAKDVSHRKVCLWTIDTANPNAWSGATEYLSSSAADFAAVQETKVEARMTGDAENTARNLGWSASVTACLQGAGGGNSAGVAIACRKHIDMSLSCDDSSLPSALMGQVLGATHGSCLQRWLPPSGWVPQ